MLSFLSVSLILHSLFYHFTITKRATCSTMFPKYSVRTQNQLALQNDHDSWIPTHGNMESFLQVSQVIIWEEKGREQEGRKGERREEEKNKVLSKKELLSLQMTAPYKQTYYSENHHMHEDFRFVTKTPTNQLSKGFSSGYSFKFQAGLEGCFASLN